MLGTFRGSRVVAVVAGAIVLSACSAGSATTVPTPSIPEITTVSVPATTRAGSDDVPDTAPDSIPDVPLSVEQDRTGDSVSLELSIGTCCNDPPADAEFVTPENVPIVDCGATHDNEVFGTLDIGEGEYPGGDTVTSRAESYCSAPFEVCVGSDYRPSSYEFSWYFPTSESWDVGGTSIICFAYNADLSPLAGSIEGSGA